MGIGLNGPEVTPQEALQALVRWLKIQLVEKQE